MNKSNAFRAEDREAILAQARLEPTAFKRLIQMVDGYPAFDVGLRVRGLFDDPVIAPIAEIFLGYKTSPAGDTYDLTFRTSADATCEVMVTAYEAFGLRLCTMFAADADDVAREMRVVMMLRGDEGECQRIGKLLNTFEGTPYFQRFVPPCEHWPCKLIYESIKPGAVVFTLAGPYTTSNAMSVVEWGFILAEMIRLGEVTPPAGFKRHDEP